jgi:hypothetical protein
MQRIEKYVLVLMYEFNHISLAVGMEGMMNSILSKLIPSSNEANGFVIQGAASARTARQSRVSHFLFVFLVLSLALFVQSAKAQVTSADYYFLDPGDRWLFSVTANGDVRDVASAAAADTTLINGVATRAVELSDGSKFFITIDEQGVRIYRLVQPAAIPVGPGVFADVIITLDPPADILAAVVNDGEMVSTNGTATMELVGIGTGTVDYQAQSTFIGIDSVTVPAGTFSDTMHVLPTLSLSGALLGQPFAQTISIEQWVGRDLSFVRYVQDVDGTAATYELVSSSRLVSSIPVFSSLLPTSRSVQTGTPATVFSTIINAGTETATQCRIAPVNSLPAAFSYQTTDPATNAVTGTADTPVDITAGNFQTFVLSLTPSAAIDPTDVEFAFACTNSAFAGNIPGVNSLLLSASDTPVPDIVALAATPSANGIVELPGSVGSNALAVATVNVGASADIIATPDTGGVTLPVSLSICETNPSTGVCINPATPAASVTTTINANATPTFAIFVTGSDFVTLDPAVNRVFVRFQDTSGVTRGSTSVAVQTL